MKKILAILFVLMVLPFSTFVFTANSDTPDLTLTSVEITSSTSVTLIWDSKYYYKGYNIYRSTTQDGIYDLVANVNSPFEWSYTDCNLTTGEKYYYKICGYDYSYNETEFSNIKSVTPLPSKISVSAISYEKNKISLTWNMPEDDVDGYIIYRATSKNGTYKRIKKINKRDTISYIDTTVEYGKFYYYKIKSFVKINGETIYGVSNDAIRNKVDISQCQAYFIKTGAIAYDIDKFSPLIQFKYGNKILKSDSDYYFYTSSYGGWENLNYVTITAYGIGDDFSGAFVFNLEPIAEKTTLEKVSVTNKGIQIKWQKEPGALGYEIYRKTGSGSYTKVKTISDNNTNSWIDKKANKINTKYTYQVRAFTKNGSKTKYAKKSDASTIKRIATPKLKSIVNKKEGIVLKWTAVEGAKSYDILRKTENGNWKYVSNTTNTQYIDRKAVVGTLYTYTVCCSNGKNQDRVSYYNKTGLKAKRLTAAEGKSQSYNSVKISWNKDKNAKGYVIYRATSAKGNYKKIATIKNNKTFSFTDKNLTFAKYYYYKVRPYSTKNGKTVYGSYGTFAKVRPILGVVSIKKVKATTHSKIKLTWGKVAKADGYQIYMSTTENGKYKKVGSVRGGNTISYIVKKLENAHTYYFKVRGYRKVKGKTYYGDFSAVKSHFIDVLGYEAEWSDSKANRIWGTDYYKDYSSSSAAKKDMTTIKIKTWDINSKGKKYTRYHYLTVHKNIAPTVKQIFIEIYNGKEKFPIKSIGGYSWRGNSSYSEHCEGLAIDINPNENAQFNGSTGKPMVGSFWKPGKNPYSITSDGEVVRIFRKYGFGWGNWFGNPDYMHFSYFGT